MLREIFYKRVAFCLQVTKISKISFTYKFIVDDSNGWFDFTKEISEFALKLLTPALFAVTS